MPSGSTRHRLALVLALAGAALSTVTVIVHERLASGSGYTGFCNLGGVVNCDAVLQSRFGVVLGVPVAAWGLAAFAAGAALALPGAVGGRTGGVADLLLLGLTSASLGFALVLAATMAAIGNVCLLCLGTDTIILPWVSTLRPPASHLDA